MYKDFFKRTIDIVASIIGLLILFPLFIILWTIIRLKIGEPVLFIQKRPGRGTKIFKLFKFRTMTNKKDQTGNLLPDHLRITPLGRFLRKASLDELPQLFNVFKGDMSLVGPRPLATKYLPFYTDKEMTRHKVRPGITGLAQISGRNNLNWDKKLDLDAQYVENLSFLLDIKILFKTLVNVIKRADVSETGVDSPGDFDVYRKKQQENKNQTNEYSRRKNCIKGY